LILLLVVAFTLAGCVPLSAAGMRPVHARKAMVASTHELASEAGVEAMRAGGNAVDAAVATGFALAVVHPQAGNLGGGGFLLLRWADGRTRFLDYRETAPAAATRNMYLDAQGDVVAGASEFGYRAIAVPGSVKGLVYAQKKWGKLLLARVMAPAIRLAREGFALAWEDADDFKDADEKQLERFPESRRIFQRDGNFYRQGEIFRQPELARTLERIAKDPDDFYRGALAKELAGAIQKGGGLITEADLAAYEVKEREPVRGTYRGYEIISAPPPSSGGIALIEALNILEGYDLKKLGNRSADAIHLTVEAFRRAFFDRAELLGDPDFAAVPVAQLLDKRYAAAWRQSIDPAHATLSAELARPAGIFEELDRVARRNSRPVPAAGGNHTTHYSVVDSEGNAAAVTTTINDFMGSRVTAEGLGFLLNNEMDDFRTKPGAPNESGLIHGEANAIAPGKRPLSSMTPTMVLQDGKLWLVTGSPGGGTIITTVANVVLGMVDYGMDVQQAVNAPHFHHQWMPDSIHMERPHFSPDTVRMLQARGHRITWESPWGTALWGSAESIAIDESTGERLGASDPRRNGKALGY